MKEMLIGRVHILTIFAVQWRKRNVQSRWGLAVFIQLHSFYHTMGRQGECVAAEGEIMFALHVIVSIIIMLGCPAVLTEVEKSFRNFNQDITCWNRFFGRPSSSSFSFFMLLPDFKTSSLSANKHFERLFRYPAPLIPSIHHTLQCPSAVSQDIKRATIFKWPEWYHSQRLPFAEGWVGGVMEK